MCGILLVYSKKKKLNKNRCNRALKAIKNRGPDATLNEYFLNERLFIANTILSIVGKIKKNNKLYTSKSERFKISYNGEIYNYKQLAKKNNKLKNPLNDTELLANILDYKKNIEVLKLLEGMFAYCIYDKKKKIISLNSDPQGEKKIFYYNSNEYLICSSTVKGILSFLNEKEIIVDKDKFKEYFETRHFLIFNKTIYNKINYLEPGKSYVYNIEKNTLKSKTFDDPINWINKKKYFKFQNKKNDFITNYFEKLLSRTAIKMLPTIPFGSLMSGGIDSSLQSKILSNSSYLKDLLFIDHGHKDPISNKIKKFSKYFNAQLNIKKLNKKKYFLNLKETYNLINLPFLTHDLVGRNLCYNFFKKKKYKVLFAADGADELFGGYELYKKVPWKDRKIINHSPYSNFRNFFSSEDSIIKKKANKLWERAYKKYNSFLPTTEAKMQASLFTDYFVQCVGVHNITTDFISGENSLEVRNIFITKSMIKNVINLPIKYKINFNNKNNLVLKPLLKNVFMKYFNKNLIFKKQGFSGFPNESADFLNNNEKKEIENLRNLFKKKIKINRATEWKLINCFYFKKFCNKRLKLTNFF